MVRLFLPLLAGLLLLVTGCTEAPQTPGHSHAGGISVSLPVGDGTEQELVGYTLTDVELPERAGVTGEVRFRIETHTGEPLTDYVEELTKDLHLYVVNEDLTVFRHVHPTMADDGTWRGPLSLPAGGDYRVIAEFVARDSGGNGDHVILGDTVAVAGAEADDVPPDPIVSVSVTGQPQVGPDGRMTLRVRDADDEPVLLGTYLGTYGHVTGFQRDTGSMIHLHPLTSPEVTEDGTSLTFHTEIERPGDYQLFAQVRVDGFLHTVPVEMTVADA